MMTAPAPMRRVAVLPWPDMPNAYLCVSGQRKKKERFGDRWYTGHEERVTKYEEDLRAAPAITFLYDAGNCCAEWDGAYGPIQLWHRCQPDFKQGYDEARPHWFYDFAFGAGHWSQMAVEEEGLTLAFVEGDYGRIFTALSSWALSHNGDYSIDRAALAEEPGQ